MADLEGKEDQEEYYQNLMWMTDRRWVEVRMTFENIRKAYDPNFRGRFQVFLPKHVTPPVKPRHILAPLEIIEVFTKEKGY